MSKQAFIQAFIDQPIDFSEELFPGIYKVLSGKMICKGFARFELEKNTIEPYTDNCSIPIEVMPAGVVLHYSSGGTYAPGLAVYRLPNQHFYLVDEE